MLIHKLVKAWIHTFFKNKNSTNEEDGYLAFSPILYNASSVVKGGIFRPDTAGIKNKNGRYRLKQISNFRKDQYMLDTETGRVWRIVVDENNEPLFQQTLLIDAENYLKQSTKKANKK